MQWLCSRRDCSHGSTTESGVYTMAWSFFMGKKFPKCRNLDEFGWESTPTWQSQGIQSNLLSRWLTSSDWDGVGQGKSQSRPRDPSDAPPKSDNMVGSRNRGMLGRWGWDLVLFGPRLHPLPRRKCTESSSLLWTEIHLLQLLTCLVLSPALGHRQESFSWRTLSTQILLGFAL